MSIISTGCSKPIIILFDTGWNFAQCMIDNIVYIILLSLTKFGDIIRDTTTCRHVLVNTVCFIAWSFLPKWDSTYHTPRYQQAKKHYKGSHGAGKYSKNLCATKKLRFKVRNCKSERHNRIRRKFSTLRPTSVHRKAYEICKQEINRIV